MTLTLRNTQHLLERDADGHLTWHVLRDALGRAWRRMRETARRRPDSAAGRLWRHIVGGAKVIEITWNKHRQTWHPHMWLLAGAAVLYFLYSRGILAGLVGAATGSSASTGTQTATIATVPSGTLTSRTGSTQTVPRTTTAVAKTGTVPTYQFGTPSSRTGSTGATATTSGSITTTGGTYRWAQGTVGGHPVGWGSFTPTGSVRTVIPGQGRGAT